MGQGITFTSLLAIVFITLKLCGVVAWSWLWVLAPVWIPTAFFALIMVAIVCVAFVRYVGQEKPRR